MFKLVLENVQPEQEFLPPHVLVLLEISKRYKAIDAIRRYKKEILHVNMILLAIYVYMCPYVCVLLATHRLRPLIFIL